MISNYAFDLIYCHPLFFIKAKLFIFIDIKKVEHNILKINNKSLESDFFILRSCHSFTYSSGCKKLTFKLDKA